MAIVTLGGGLELLRTRHSTEQLITKEIACVHKQPIRGVLEQQRYNFYNNHSTSC